MNSWQAYAGFRSRSLTSRPEVPKQLRRQTGTCAQRTHQSRAHAHGDSAANPAHPRRRFGHFVSYLPNRPGLIRAALTERNIMSSINQRIKHYLRLVSSRARLLRRTHFSLRGHEGRPISNYEGMQESKESRAAPETRRKYIPE
ncbi:hypothetical protein EVAR_64402_1 [Eumeta japonica]|uniref:Uncharacterized protein n=1 Tax=Eumeta variegata TaxID=151549 RepID=A0A4C1ZXL3_EUMVA|nr:hypothetical protein EVAR_64402_1 [Eumeta japonica]